MSGLPQRIIYVSGFWASGTPLVFGKSGFGAKKHFVAEGSRSSWVSHLSPRAGPTPTLGWIMAELSIPGSVSNPFRW